MAPPAARRTRPELLTPTHVVTAAVATAALAALAMQRLAAFPYPLDLSAAIAGARETAAATLPAAAVVWSVIAVLLAAIVAILRRAAPDLDTAERIAGAVVLTWAGAYLLLLTLGPLGLFRSWVLRGFVVVVAAAAALTRRPAERSPRHRPPSVGAFVAVVAAALSVVPLLVLQVGSPVSPFMDVLPYVASTQKIVTFQHYDAFANDAAGLWSPTRQVVGTDALLSFVALVAGLPAHLATTALIVPMALLQLFGLYLVGRAALGRVDGGFATLFLLQTFLWRRTPDVRGTALAFAVAAIGIALLVHALRSRDGARLALGGLALGVAVTVNPLIGGCGMELAALVCLLAWADTRASLTAPIAALTGAALFALPQVLVGVHQPAPAAILPLAALVGVGALWLAGRLAGRAHRANAPAEPTPRSRQASPIGRTAVITGVVLAFLLMHAEGTSEVVNDRWYGYEILTFLTLAGLLEIARRVLRAPRRHVAAALPALGVTVAFVNYSVAAFLMWRAPSVEIYSALREVLTKMPAYWLPYWMALAAGAWLGVLARRWSTTGAIALALFLVVYPLKAVERPLDYDGVELSVAETWGFQLTSAARGYHRGRRDARWVIDERWRTVSDALRAEIDAGRLRYDTHVVHVAPTDQAVELALATGISVDVVVPEYDPNNIWNAGSRLRGADSLPAILAARPRYVLLERRHPFNVPELARDYEELVTVPPLRLYRLRD
jgi:hypothetical protein